jgi:aryl-alcohol dehydrogenase-like predicted oxidoreductase
LPLEKLQELKGLAERNAMSMTTMSLAWVGQQPGITSPIIGARSVRQLKESAAALEIQLSSETLSKIDEIFGPGSHHVNYYAADFGPNARPN